MLGNLGQIAATVSLNIDPFQVSQRVLNSSIKATAAELRAQDAAFKGSEKSINNMRSTYDTLSRQSKNYQAQLQKQREQYDENSKAVERLNKSETASQEEINRATKLQANAASQPYAKRLRYKVTAGLKYQTVHQSLHLLPKRQALS